VSDDEEEEDEEGQWLVVRPRADATRTSKQLSEARSTSKPPFLSLDTTFLSQPNITKRPTFSTYPHEILIVPQPTPPRSSSKPAMTASLPPSSNRPLPPKPVPQPPPYLQNSTVKSIISPPPPPSEDAYTYKTSLFAALDSNSDANLSSPNPAPPVRSHSSPPTIILGSNQGASAEKLDRPDDGEGEGAGSSRRAGGTARLRTLFFSGRLGGARREKEQLMGMAAGKSTFGSETERLSRFFFSLSFTVGPRSTRRAFGPILFTQPFTPPYSSPTDPLFFHTSSFFTLAFRSQSSIPIEPPLISSLPYPPLSTPSGAPLTTPTSLKARSSLPTHTAQLLWPHRLMIPLPWPRNLHRTPARYQRKLGSSEEHMSRMGRWRRGWRTWGRWRKRGMVGGRSGRIFGSFERVVLFGLSFRFGSEALNFVVFMHYLFSSWI